MEILQKILELSLLIIAILFLMLFAFGFLLIEELNNYCKKEVDKDAHEQRAKRRAEE